MDLFYRYEVFSRSVLVLARDHPMLRYAACAVAAKQLSQVRGRLPTAAYNETQQRVVASINAGTIGFAWYSIKYYELAIQTLVQSISRKTANTRSMSGFELMVRADGEDPVVRLLGTCILIQYEHLDANRAPWAGHLAGFAKLIEISEDGKLLQRYHEFEEVYPWTRNIMSTKAAFWNFVVNDMEEACKLMRPIWTQPKAFRLIAVKSYHDAKHESILLTRRYGATWDSLSKKMVPSASKNSSPQLSMSGTRYSRTRSFGTFVFS